MKIKTICHCNIRQLVREVRISVGKNIHAARIKSGITLMDLAEATYLTPDAIDRIELGKGEVDFVHLARLSVALQIDLQHLFHQVT